MRNVGALISVTSTRERSGLAGGGGACPQQVSPHGEFVLRCLWPCCQAAREDVCGVWCVGGGFIRTHTEWQPSPETAVISWS